MYLFVAMLGCLTGRGIFQKTLVTLPPDDICGNRIRLLLLALMGGVGFKTGLVSLIKAPMPLSFLLMSRIVLPALMQNVQGHARLLFTFLRHTPEINR